jgi:hypothetical protein
MLSGEAKNNYFDSLWFDPIGAEPTIYCNQGEHANHYTIDAVFFDSISI